MEGVEREGGMTQLITAHGVSHYLPLWEHSYVLLLCCCFYLDSIVELLLSNFYEIPSSGPPCPCPLFRPLVPSHTSSICSLCFFLLFFWCCTSLCRKVYFELIFAWCVYLQRGKWSMALNQDWSGLQLSWKRLLLHHWHPSSLWSMFLCATVLVVLGSVHL